MANRATTTQVPPQVSNAYSQARQRLLQATTTAAVVKFGLELGNQLQGERDILALVASAMAATANLVSGYLMALTGRTPQVPQADYTVQALRRADALKVYSQPWAAMTVALQKGETLDAARLAGQAKVTKLVSTDLQLAQTHAARDWMSAPGSGVTGWLRVPDAGACELCQAAAGRVYHTADLMPIHEHCGCGVEPVMDSSPKLSAINAGVRVVDSDIGPRLMAADWSV